MSNIRSDIPVALPCFLFIDYNDVAGVDTDQVAADVGRFVVPFKCQVILAALVVTEVCAGTLTPVVAFDKRPTAGSDTDRGDGDIANFVMGTTAAGKVLYDLAAAGTVLTPGEEVIIEITVQPTDAASGHFVPYLLVEALPETKANLGDLVATA